MTPATRPARATPIHLRAPADLLREIDRQAALRGQTRTRVIFEAVRRQLAASRETPEETP